MSDAEKHNTRFYEHNLSDPIAVGLETIVMSSYGRTTQKHTL